MAFLICLALLVAYKGIRAYRTEHAVFTPRKGFVVRPAAANEIVDLQDVHFPNEDGTRLAGWYAKSQNGAAIVFLHGSSSDRSVLADTARALASRGYGVLLYDSPGHGESAGSVVWGASERAALRSAVTFITRQPDVDPQRIGSLGVSMGAYILLQTAATDSRLRASVAEAAPADALLQTRYESRDRGTLSMWSAELALRLSPMNLGEPQPIALVNRITPRALMIVAGDADISVPPAMAHELYAAAGQPKQLWMVHGANHGGCRTVAGPAAYDARIAAFFDQYLFPAQRDDSAQQSMKPAASP